MHARVTICALTLFLLGVAPPARADWTYTGCLSAATDAPLAGCATAGPLRGASGIAVSADGATVYVAGRLSDGLALLARDPTTGGLRALACISDDGTDGRDGTDGACVDADALQGPAALALHGAGVYVASAGSGSVTSFGLGLTPLQCLKGRAEGRCALSETALAGARTLALAGDHLYVAGGRGSGAVTILRRDTATGALVPAGCVSADGLDGHCDDAAALRAPTALALTPDGRTLYVAASGSHAVTSFARDPATGGLRQTGCVQWRVLVGDTCRSARSLHGAYALALSPDGRDLYVAGRSGRISLLRQGLRVAGCRGSGRCTSDVLLDGVRALALTPDARALVAATPGGLELLVRDSATGALRRDACVLAQRRRGVDCAVVPAVAGARSIAISPDGRDVYVGTSAGLVTFRLGAPA